MITIGYMPRTLQQSQLVTCCSTIDVARTGLPSITWLTIYQTDTLKKLIWQQKVWFHHVSIAIDSQVVIWICWSTLVPFAHNIYTTYSSGSFGPDLFGIFPKVCQDMDRHGYDTKEIKAFIPASIIQTNYKYQFTTTNEINGAVDK